MSMISESLDGTRIGYKGRVYVAVPEGMTISHAENLLANADTTPTPPPDAVREAGKRLEHTYRSSPCASFMVNGGDLRLILDHFKEQCDD